MDTYRLFVGMVFAISVFLLVDAWVKDQASPAKSVVSTGTQSGAQQAPPPIPTLSGTPSATSGATQPASSPLGKGERIEVRTDFLAAEIDTLGGDLRRVELLQHRDRTDRSKNFVLLQDGVDQVYIAQSGLIGNGLPSHNTRYATASTHYELAPG